eukprot:CAMPEP_0173356096 /NCGR_PEP_ID=MMETSP1144-20121109/18124_1 /TAXON_ID=483371 /ORGANISM="non described non described, Strain CCMP2298" /LENGTH=72 /DNA_ID=CAMNT_0014304865 /DNA_START=204 /DNA_END=422 /DNA_ORIENTATION=+
MAATSIDRVTARHLPQEGLPHCTHSASTLRFLALVMAALESRFSARSVHLSFLLHTLRKLFRGMCCSSSGSL